MRYNDFASGEIMTAGGVRAAAVAKKATFLINFRSSTTLWARHCVVISLAERRSIARRANLRPAVRRRLFVEMQNSRNQKKVKANWANGRANRRSHKQPAEAQPIMGAGILNALHGAAKVEGMEMVVEGIRIGLLRQSVGFQL